jgi:HK97 gp10 family phage protein
MMEFESVALFAEHLLTLEVAIEATTHRALEKAARVVEKDAKGQIGTYQDAVGPFQDWALLADSTEAEKARLGYPADAPLLRDGTLRDSIEHEVEGNEAVIGSKSDVAEYQEFGTKTIPPRPFMGPAVFKNKEKIQRILGEALVEGLIGGAKVHSLLGYDDEIKP